MTRSIDHSACSIDFISNPFTLIFITIPKLQLSKPVPSVIAPIADIRIPIFEIIGPLAVALISYPLSFVDSNTIVVDHGALSVWFVRFRISSPCVTSSVSHVIDQLHVHYLGFEEF